MVSNPGPPSTGTATLLPSTRLRELSGVPARLPGIDPPLNLCKMVLLPNDSDAFALIARLSRSPVPPLQTPGDRDGNSAIKTVPRNRWNRLPIRPDELTVSLPLALVCPPSLRPFDTTRTMKSLA
jgi:hypothetical protein